MRVVSGATSAHFTESELRCHGTKCGPNGTGCGVNGCTQELVDALEAFRTIAGQPVIVNDAYRCPQHNSEVGGAKGSQHMLGEAADIRIPGMVAAQLERIARQVPAIKGIGRADLQNYLHIDVRSTLAAWCYASDGTQCAYYPPVA